MTQTELNHPIDIIRSLPSDQLRQVFHEVESRTAEPTALPKSARKQEAATTRRKGQPSVAAKPKPLTLEQLHHQMMAEGLITQLPNPSEDIDDDDPADQPIVIQGEPLSATIIRERR